MKGAFQILLACVCVLHAVSAEEWWTNANFYQIYPRSFQDSNGDGVGDLNGISQRLEYFNYLGIDGIWLSPIFKSPMKDGGYDISDYRDIHHEFGTMADFDHLLERCKELGIKLLLDFVPNHSSDQHKWFIASADPNHEDHAKYKDYYIWHKGIVLADGTRAPPSNWLSIFRHRAWTFHEKRQAYYLHQFLPAQPDLNYRSPAVAREMEDVLRFWYDKGVDGFRIDAIPHLFEVDVNPATNTYDDEALSGDPNCGPDDHCYLVHDKTTSLDETYDFIYQWRVVSDSYKDKARVFMTEAYTSTQNAMRYYGGIVDNKLVNGSHVPFNFELIGGTNKNSMPSDYQTIIQRWLNSMPKREGVYANWVLGNHDNKRIATRYNAARIDLFNILLNTLPGISVTYYGEEIGMKDVEMSNENDFRDTARTPFQWDSSLNAGFSTAAETWLPVADDYKINNVQVQIEKDRSHLKVFTKLLELRKLPGLKNGQFAMTTFGDVLIYSRQVANDASADSFFVLLNFGTTKVNVPLSKLLRSVPAKLTVAVVSIESQSLLPGDTISSSSIDIDGGVGVVFNALPQ